MSGCGSESDSSNERVNEVPAVERRAPRGALKAYPVVLKTEMVRGNWFYLFIYSPRCSSLKFLLRRNAHDREMTILQPSLNLKVEN